MEGFSLFMIGLGFLAVCYSLYYLLKVVKKAANITLALWERASEEGWVLNLDANLEPKKQTEPGEEE